MTAWYWYLLASAALSASGYVVLNIFFNFVLAAGVHVVSHMPARVKWYFRLPAAVLLAAAAAALLWHESYLPPASTIISFLVNPATRPDARYLAEFIMQSVNVPMLLCGALLLAAAWAGVRRRPMLLTACAYVLMLAAWVAQPRQNVGDLDGNTPEAFFSREALRSVDFPAKPDAGPAFDVIVLHICSLSWTDIKDSGADLLPFLSRFDYVLTGFNSATGYSKIAAMRVLKSPCGQAPSARLFDEAPAGCYLMDDLRALGYTPYTMFSHDGRYDDYNTEVQKYGHAAPPLGVAGLPVMYTMFDGSPLYSDAAALEKVWKARQASGAPRAAIYYNTVNLHIGTHKPGASRGPEDATAYRQRLTLMAGQFDAFFAGIERSGRNAVVVLVPEHGAALTGNRMQAKDVREIPLPPITAVPAAVKLVGKAFRRAAAPQVITKPTSLMALAWFVAEFLRNNPYAQQARSPEVVAADVPSTDFFSENYDTAVMRAGFGYIFKQKGAGWAPLPAYAGIQDGVIPPPSAFAPAGR